MLQKFKVQNYKNFRDEFVWDFANTKSYEFNEQLVEKGILKAAIVYGKNAAGKTNLGLAITDITIHLTDFSQASVKKSHYKNLLSHNKTACFEYTFCFDDNVLVYFYEKEDRLKLIREVVRINGREVLSADINCAAKVNLKGAEQLNIDVWNGSISLVKYVAKNTILDKNDINSWTFMQFIRFVEHMIWFSSTEGNMYSGYSNFEGSICENIAQMRAIDELQEFLHELGIEVQLMEKEEGEQKNICCVYKNKIVLFQDVWSSGTRALCFLFVWYLQMKNMSFVYVDEFDAFYHYELAEAVVRKLVKSGAQVVFTSHNTDLMTNDLLRPDCYFELKDNQIKSFSDSTSKALRQAHNIQKMYKAGAFDEK